MASRLGVSLEGWPNTPKSPQPIWGAQGKNGEFLICFCSLKRCTYTQKGKNTHAGTLQHSQNTRQRTEILIQPYIHSQLEVTGKAALCWYDDEQKLNKRKTTHVIHEHDDYVWRWNSEHLLCPGATYYYTKESQSLSRHHSHCCALVIWASTSRKWFVCLRASLQRNTCAYSVELMSLSMCYFNLLCYIILCFTRVCLTVPN